MVFIAGIFVSCEGENSADVNQDKIHTRYELFYNSNSDKTLVLAQFRFGGPLGTVLELVDSPSSVSFEGENLPYNAVYSGHAKEFAGQISGGSFTYMDLDSNVFVNQVPDYSFIGFPENLDTISKSEALEIIWDGDALLDDEHVGVFIGSWKWGDDAGAIQSGVGSSNIIIGTDRLSNLPMGPANLFMDRTQEGILQQGTSEGGQIISKFRARNLETQVVE